MTGCATIIHGTTEKIAVSSTPTDAQVMIKGVPVASTPGIIELKRIDTNIVLRLEKEGYEPSEVILNRKYSGWIAGNLAIPLVGLVGGAVDFGSGAAYKLVPTEVYIDLQKQEMREDDSSREEVVVAVDPDSTSLYIEEKDDSTQSKQKKGHLTYGYGVSGVYLIFPIPFVECGLRIGAISLRGNIGFNLAYAEARVELALFDRFYIYDGASVMIQVDDPGDIFGIGMDIDSRDNRKYFRFELGFLEYDGGRESFEAPRVGIGWRF